MLLLPTFNAALNPCPVDPAAFTPHEKGRFCGQCQRVVQDFTQSPDPATDLSAARAASPDGRVCGSFRRSQVAAAPTLSRRLRWFVVALVLVVGQGLTAREALAQVRQAPDPLYHSAMPQRVERAPVQEQKTQPPEKKKSNDLIYGVVVEQLAQLRGGGGMRAIVDSIQRRVQWPQQDGNMLPLEGRVFASFTVEADGRITDVKTVKSLHPAFDEAVLVAIRGLKGFVPGRQNGRPVLNSFVVPITFRLAD